MDLLESAFLSKTQKLNEKRQEQLMKRMGKLLPEIESAYEKGEKEELEGLLESIQMPSQKEWKKNVHSLCLNSAKAGVLRAHLEVMKLKKDYQFNEFDWEVEIGDGGTDYEVVFPKEAQDWIRTYGYEIGVITEDTVRERIRWAIEKGLVDGTRGRDLNQMVLDVTNTWLGMAHAETIARTETSKMYNAGRIARWSDPELNGFVEALQYDAIVDTLTTDFCRTIDGKIISMANTQAIAEYTPPNHFRCRATWIAVTEFEEWTDDFPAGLKPEKGFVFEAPLPHMLKGKKEPLVQVKKEIRLDPKRLTEPDLIRNLNDEDFAIAIGNIEDTGLRLSMAQERAEKMLIADEVFHIEKGRVDLTWYGFNKDALEGTFEAQDTKFKFHMTPAIEDDVYDLMARIKYLDVDQIEEVLEKYTKEHASSLAHLDIVRAIREAKINTKGFAFEGKGLKRTGLKSKEVLQQQKIKAPPMTENYRNAVGLQKALSDGQQWINDYIPEKWVPAEKVRLKFDKNLRRAYAKGNDVYFGPNENRAGVIVHEFAHVLHSSSGSVQDMTHTWFMKRTNDLKLPHSLRMGEEVIKDDFYESYIGRIYGWEEKHGDYYKRRGDIKVGIYGQEVVSMGVQAMYENPRKFYNDDKDHFLFIYALMKGLY